MLFNYQPESSASCFEFCDASSLKTTQSQLETRVGINLGRGGEESNLALGRGGPTGANLLRFLFSESRTLRFRSWDFPRMYFVTFFLITYLHFSLSFLHLLSIQPF